MPKVSEAVRELVAAMRANLAVESDDNALRLARALRKVDAELGADEPPAKGAK